MNSIKIVNLLTRGIFIGMVLDLALALFVVGFVFVFQISLFGSEYLGVLFLVYLFYLLPCVVMGLGLMVDKGRRFVYFFCCALVIVGYFSYKGLAIFGWVAVDVFAGVIFAFLLGGFMLYIFYKIIGEKLYVG